MAPTHQSIESKKLSPTDRVLRIINVLTFFPGLAFLIATGVTRSKTWAFVGIGPISLSGFLGLVVLFLDKPYTHQTCAADFVVGVFALIVDIVGWATPLWWDGMLAGHATSALLVQFLIHGFFVLRYGVQLLRIPELFARLNPFRPADGCSRCPHCLSEARAKKVSVKAVGKETYHRVPGRDGGEYDEEVDGATEYRDARPSTEDETARLV